MRVIRVEMVIGIDETTPLGQDLIEWNDYATAGAIADVLDKYGKGTNQHAPFHVIAARGESLEDTYFIAPRGG